MIKIVKAEYLDDYRIRLFFSDATVGDFDANELISRDGPMVAPLRDKIFFQDFFLELGALCWKNGFELSPGSLHGWLKDKGLLRSGKAAA